MRTQVDLTALGLHFLRLPLDSDKYFMTRVLPFAVHVYSLWYVCTYKCWGAYFLPSLCSASHSGHTRSAYAGTWAGCSTNVTKLYESLQNSKEQKCNTEHVSYCGPTNVRLGATVPEQPGSSDSCTHAYVCVCVCVCVRARAIPLLHLWAVMVCFGLYLIFTLYSATEVILLLIQFQDVP